MLNLTEKYTYLEYFILIIRHWMLNTRRIYYGYSHKKFMLREGLLRTTIYYACILSGGWGAKGRRLGRINIQDGRRRSTLAKRLFWHKPK